MSCKISMRHRGPLVVEGEVRLFDPEGNPIERPPGSKLMLCRCGASSSRPFCDGSHYRTDFEAPPPEDGPEEAG